ncbi:unnamed protein product, partial [Closterium sp. NIES-54]
CDSKDGLSLFDLTSGASTAPAADADSIVRSQWTTRDAAARLAVRSHLPSIERAHFSQYKSAKTLYDAIVARYSSLATAALSRLMLPYLFPDLAAFATVADLVAHLRTSDARYRAALPTAFLPTNSPPMYITLYYLLSVLLAATVAPPSLRGVPLSPFSPLLPLLLLSTLLALRRSALRLPLVGNAAPARAREAGVVEGAVGEAVEAVEEVEVVVGVVPGVGASVAAVEAVAAVAEEVEAAAAVVEVAEEVVLVAMQPRSVEALVAASASSSCAPVRPRRFSSFVSGTLGVGGLGVRFPDAVELPRWHDLLMQNVPIFDLDFDAILAAMYAFADITEGDSYLSVPPDPGTVAAALGASAAAALGAGTSPLSGTAPTDTTLTPLSRPVEVSLADPSGGPVLAHSSTVLPCPAAPSGLLSGHHLPSFSTNLVSGADLQDAWVDQFTLGGQRVTHCTCSRMGRHLATFNRRPGSSLYTLTTAPPPVPASGQVAASSQMFAAASRSSPASAPCLCRPLAHETLLWHHRLGHPSLPRLRGMASRALVSGLPRSLPPLPPGPAPTCVPCVEGRQRAAPHSSSFPPTEAPLQTLHMDVWGPARVRGQGHERYFLLVVDDYSRYTTVFPLRSKGEVTEALINWIRGARRQLSESFGSDLPVLRLHSDRGGEFSSNLLRAFCRFEGIRQTFTLPASPQQNGIVECRIGMVMDVARTSMIHAATPHLGGDPDALDIPTPRSYAEAIEGPYSSQWQAAMDAEMASWKSTGTYVDEVPPPGANIVSGMWIFRVKRLPGSPPAFKARYVAPGFSQRLGVDFFQNFSPTPKMTTLRVLLHVAAQRDYELHSLDFSTAFLQGSLHEEIWLRRPPGFTGSFPAGTQWSLRRPVYGLRQAPHEWHDTLRTTLASLGFAPSTADPSLFLRTDATLPPFYVLVYVDDLVFATADTEALAHVKSELQKRHTCTDLGELTSYLGLRIIRDRAQRTITLTQSHMVQQVLQRFGFTYSSPQSTPLPTGHSLSAPPSDESVEPSGLYPELVGCLMYLMTCTRPDLAYPLSLLARYVAPARQRKVHLDAAKRVLCYLCSTSGMGLVLGGRARVVLTGHADASWELLWLTYLLTDLGETPRSPTVLSNNGSSVTSPACPTASPAADNSHLQQQQHQQQQYQQQPMYGMPLSSQPVHITTAAASSTAAAATAASAASTAAAAVPGSSSQPGQQSNFVPTGPYQYQGWGDTTNMPTNDGIWGADEPDETTWGETPAERAARLLAEAEQRVADMEILDSGRLVGVEPVPAASDQESSELVLAPGEYVDVEVRVPPPNLTRYVAPAFDHIRSNDHQLLLSFFANAEYYLRAQGHKATGETWHKRLGHPSQSTLNNTIKAAVLDKNSLLLPSGLELKPVNRLAPCTICPIANLPHELFPTHFPGAEDYRLMEKVYSDILNLPSEGFNGEKYVIMFTEASTRYIWTAGEYRSLEFTSYLQERGIRRLFSLSHAHQQSGVAERLNRTLQEKMRALLSQAHLGPLHWPFAMDHATLLHNLLSSLALPNNASPHLLWTGKLGTTKLLRVFGCVIQYRPPTAPLGKFDQRAKWGQHLGIEKHYFAWRIMDYRSRLIVPARDCIFYENLTLPVFKQHLASQQNPATLFHGVQSFANADVEIAASEEPDSDGAREAASDPPVRVMSSGIPEFIPLADAAPEDVREQHLNRKLTEVGFRQLPHDPGMYRLDDKGSYALLVAYVDDILYASLSTSLGDRIEADLKKSLDFTISTKVTQFLGLSVSRTTSAIHLTASKYAESLAKRFNIPTDFVATPYRSTLTGHVPNLKNLSATGLQLYQQQLGCLLFAAVTCRPDLAYVASHLA